MKKLFKETVKSGHIFITAILTVVMLGIMDIYTLPFIAKAAGGIPAFDLQTLGYSEATAQAFLSALSESGRSMFLHVQLPLDFMFAFVYTFLFLALFIRLNKVGEKLYFIPLVLFVLDIAENILSLYFLTSASVSSTWFAIGSAVTLLKNVFTLICTVMILVFLIIWLIQRKKAKNA